MPALLQLQKLPGKGGGWWGKSVFASFFGWLEDREFVERKKKRSLLEHPIARATNYRLLPDTSWLRASQNAFKVGSVKFAKIHLHRLPLWRKYAPEVKTAKGLKRWRARELRELTTPPESPNRYLEHSPWWFKKATCFGIVQHGNAAHKLWHPASVLACTTDVRLILQLLLQGVSIVNNQVCNTKGGGGGGGHQKMVYWVVGELIWPSGKILGW